MVLIGARSLISIFFIYSHQLAGVDAQEKQVKQAQKLNVPVVSPDFAKTVNEVKSIVDVMKSTLISSWTDPEDIRSRLLNLNESFEKPSSSSKSLFQVYDWLLYFEIY